MPQIQRDTGTSLSEINMIPFIDVVLVLLIIFMITAPILQSGIEVDVPKTKTVKELTEQRMVITIDRAQRVYLNDKPVNIHDLGGQVTLADEGPAAPGGVCALRRDSSLRQLGDCGGFAASVRHTKYQRGDAAAHRARADSVKWLPSPQIRHPTI